MRSIAAALGILRNSVAKAVSADGPTKYVRAPQDARDQSGGKRAVRELIGSLCAVPRRLIWDNFTGIRRRNSCAAGVAAFTGS